MDKKTLAEKQLIFETILNVAKENEKRLEESKKLNTILITFLQGMKDGSNCNFEILKTNNIYINEKK